VPALACVVRRALTRLAEKRTDVDGLAPLVEIDAVLTGAVTRIVRGPIYAVPEPRPDVARAVSMIGRDAMERVLRSLPLVGGPPAQTERACRLWTHGVAVAAAARFLSNQGACEASEDAYLAGLVHDVGRLAATDADGADVAARTESIASSWRLGPRVVAAARQRDSSAPGVNVAYGDPDGDAVDPTTARLVAVVARGAALAVRLGYGGDAESSDGAPDDADACAVREAIELELAHAADLLGFPPPSPGEFVAALVQAETAARREMDDEPRGAAQIVTPARLAALHHDVVDVRGMTAVQDMLARGLCEIHARLGFDRIALFKADPAVVGVLHARLVLDPTGFESSRRPGAVQIPSTPGGAAARAIESESACRGGDPVLDRAALECLGVSSFAVVPLRGGAAGLGVVFADRFLSDQPVTDEDAEVLAMLCAALGLAVENAALDAAGKMLRALAEKDDLTGINNRRSVFAVFQREIDRARRYGKPLSLVMIDVDHFKSWNDVHGHHVGDQVLQAVAQIVTSVSRDIDVFGRYGGEEFLVVLPETPVDHAVIYAERLRATIAAHGESLTARYPGTSLSVSVGVAAMNVLGDDADKMVQRADAALYAAKRHGRNRVCVDVASVEPPRASPASDAGM
jgi:diguanylate cyclase (GGDEF)-like protein